jgi:PAS domain S-box-containing protein
MPYSRLRQSLNIDDGWRGWMEMTEALPDTVFVAEPSGYNIFVSRTFRDFTGLTPEELLDDGWLRTVHHEDLDRASTAWETAMRSRGRYDETYRFIGRDGEERWLRCRAAPTLDNDGHVVRWVGVASDVHDHMLAEERKQTVVHELRHRQKNLLAMVRAIVDLTSRDEPDLSSFRSTLAERLTALARISDRLAHTDFLSLDLRHLILVEAAPFRGFSAGKMSVHGPDVQIPAGSVVAVALIVHELLTNAVKYGALSVPEGRLSVTWIVHNGLAHVSWVEAGGPAAGQSTEMREGFGARLIRSIAPRDLGGPVDYQLDPAGIRCRFSFVLD